MPGVKGKSGRKSKAEELGIQALLDDAFTPTDRRKVVENLARIAKSHLDAKAAVSAATLLLGYAYGKPKEKHEHSTDSFEIVVKHVSGTPQES